MLQPCGEVKTCRLYIFALPLGMIVNQNFRQKTLNFRLKRSWFSSSTTGDRNSVGSIRLVNRDKGYIRQFRFPQTVKCWKISTDNMARDLRADNNKTPPAIRTYSAVFAEHRPSSTSVSVTTTMAALSHFSIHTDSRHGVASTKETYGSFQRFRKLATDKSMS